LLALEPRLEHVRLLPRRSLHEPGEPLRHVVFPASGIVSLLHVDYSGASAQLTVAGCEGMIGLELLLGAETPASRAVVQIAGSAFRLRASDARAAFAGGGRFQSLALRFAHALTLEVSQTAACNLHHHVEPQLCRWLLLCLDRLQGDEIGMTHEMIATSLGVRRQGVTEAAKKLQERKFITSSRGRIRVLDRAALEACACECYSDLKRRTAALFADVPGLASTGAMRAATLSRT
jgi:CRP-like cAMP-binding protein